MKLIRFIAFLVLAQGLFSCANRAAGPTGGPKDTIPPIVIRSVPENGAINFRKKEILVYFNENVTLDKISEHLVVSPPQKQQPVVKANAKQLSLKFEDELQDSTTYSVLFGDAIVDLNEKNPLKNYVFSFATGNEIDTLQIAGRLIHAENLDPATGVLVGLHKNLHDTAIVKENFVRVAKTNDEGEFVITNVKAGEYKVYALSDTNRDFMHQPGESVAFYDSIVIPEVKTIEHADTIWLDSLNIDTIHIHRAYSYHPDNLLLKHFKETKKRQYLIKAERANEKYFQFVFNDKQDSLPEIKPLNFDVDAKFLLQTNLTQDSLVYWISDSIVYQQDTLSMEVSYFKSDSIYQLVQQTDTFNLAMRKPRAAKTKPGKEELKTVPLLNLKTNLSSSFDVYRTITLESEEPLATIETSMMHLYQKVDTLYELKAFDFQRLDSIHRRFEIKHQWIPEQEYKFEIDSAACVSIYDRNTDKQTTSFKIKSLDDYSTLKIVLESYDPLAVIQVLDTKETIIQTKAAMAKGTTFEHLNPGDYFVRLFIDTNQNGLWDTGDLEARRQPEEVIYFHKKLSLRSNWELEESWNHLDETKLNLKPEELIPKKKK